MDQYARRRGSVGTGAPLSLEASLDEENKEVLATLGKQRSNETRRRVSRGESPLPSIRSMLDVDSPPQSRHGSIAGIGVGVTSPRDQRRPSKRLDPADPSTWTKPHRAASPASIKSTVAPPPTGLPKINFDEKESFEQQYKFDMASMPTSTGAATRGSQRSGSIHSAATLDNDMSNFHVGSTSPTIAVSPPEKTSIYTRSPTSGSTPLMLTPEISHIKSPTATNTVPDAYRRMSNKSSSFSDMSEGPTGRIEKDEDGDEDALAYSSDDEEEEARSSSSDDGSPEDERGRAREKALALGKDEVEQKHEEKQDKEVNAPQSKGVRSLLDPLTSPSRPADRKSGIHPPSNFGKSGPTAADFEDEEDADIQKAKNLGVNISPVDNSIADRHVRMIIRGEWGLFQEEAEHSNRETKLYLTCTDMSTEASYALEWTVGTMLRDGDTLLAIYAIEDENAPKEPEGNALVLAESAKAAQQAGDTMAKLTRQATDLDSQTTKYSTKFLPVTEALTSTGSVDARSVSKKEMERLRAMDEITEKFLKLVRKTPLQIRCMIEVIHCKSPKHLIINAIDVLDPTLCVVGTRGRSSLKGVLLGSFSNYLVTKSSVPVMVARKRLKKARHAKVNSTSIRLSNNLRAPALARPRRGLENARID